MQICILKMCTLTIDERKALEMRNECLKCNSVVHMTFSIRRKAKSWPSLYPVIPFH